MSWYVKAIGVPSKVKAALEEQFSRGTCMEPEETARQAAKTAMLTVVAAYPENIPVLAHGQGSQSMGNGGTVVVGEFTIRVEALTPLLSDI